MLAMWLATVFVLSESSRAISWLLSPLARRVKISSSRSVRARADRDRGTVGVLDGDVELANALQELPGDLRGEHGFSCGGGSDGADDRVGWRALEDVAAGAGDDRFDDAVLF